VSPPFSPASSAASALPTLSLHDALPISADVHRMEPGNGPLHVRIVFDDRDGLHHGVRTGRAVSRPARLSHPHAAASEADYAVPRSEEHTSELQSRVALVCRPLPANNTRH